MLRAGQLTAAILLAGVLLLALVGGRLYRSDLMQAAPMPAAAGGASAGAAAALAWQPPVNTGAATLRRPKIVLFGDSLTERSFDPDGGWGAALAHGLYRRVDVLNRGFGGYTTRCALAQLPDVFGPADTLAGGTPPLLATVLLGANDAAMPGRGAAAQHVPLPEYRANLAAIVAGIRAAGVATVVLLTPPPVDDVRRVLWQQQRSGRADIVDADRTHEFTARYAAACCEVARELGTPCVDLFAGLQDVPGWRGEYLADGLHLSAAGSRRAYSLLARALAAAAPQLSPERLPWHWPFHGSLDWENPAATFDTLRKPAA